MRDSRELMQLIHQSMINAGVDMDELYRRLGRSGWDRLLSKDRFRHVVQPYFWGTVEAVTGDREVGLHLCPHMPVYRGHIIEYLFLSSPTFGEGLRAAIPYQRLISDALKVALIDDKLGARITLRGTTNNAPQLRHPEICYAYEFMRIVNMVTESRVWPGRIRLCCDRRAPQSEYEQVFQCPVEFGAPVSEVWIDPAVLDLPSPHRDSYMFELHRQHADLLLQRLAQQDLIDDIYDHFQHCFESGEYADAECLTISKVSAALQIPTRRLRRQLAEAETSFRALLKRSRFSFARRKLHQTDEPVESIASGIGFSEPSAFYRAFKEWSGMPPSQYRDRYRIHQATSQPAALRQ